MSYIIFFLLNTVVTGLILWCASKLTSVNLFLKEIIIVACAASLATFIPYFGWLASIVVLFYFLKKFSRATIWPNLILVLIILVEIVSKFYLLPVFAFLSGLQ